MRIIDRKLMRTGYALRFGKKWTIKWHNCKTSRINKDERMGAYRRYILQPDGLVHCGNG